MHPQAHKSVACTVHTRTRTPFMLWLKERERERGARAHTHTHTHTHTNARARTTTHYHASKHQTDKRHEIRGVLLVNGQSGMRTAWNAVCFLFRFVKKSNQHVVSWDSQAPIVPLLSVFSLFLFPICRRRHYHHHQYTTTNMMTIMMVMVIISFLSSSSFLGHACV